MLTKCFLNKFVFIKFDLGSDQIGLIVLGDLKQVLQGVVGAQWANCQKIRTDGQSNLRSLFDTWKFWCPIFLAELVKMSSSLIMGHPVFIMNNKLLEDYEITVHRMLWSQHVMIQCIIQFWKLQIRSGGESYMFFLSVTWISKVLVWCTPCRCPCSVQWWTEACLHSSSSSLDKLHWRSPSFGLVNMFL